MFVSLLFWIWCFQILFAGVKTTEAQPQREDGYRHWVLSPNSLRQVFGYLLVDYQTLLLFAAKTTFCLPAEIGMEVRCLFVCYYHYYYDYVCYQYHYHWISKWMFVCQQEFRYRLRNATSLTPGLLCSSINKQTNIQNKNQRKINKETNDSAILTEVRLYLYSLIKGGRREEGEEAGLLLVVVVVGPRAGRSIPRHGPRPPTIPSSPPPPLPTPPPPPLPISPIQPTPLT